MASWSNKKGKLREHTNFINEQWTHLNWTSKNPNIKLDIITCTSLLNACAFEKTDSEAGRANTMEIVIKSLEAL